MNTKIEVIDAFIKHELGLEVPFTNSVYDAKLALVMEEDKDFNPFNYLPLPEDAEVGEHRSELLWLEKFSTSNNDITEYWNKENGKVKLPKYDGSSLVAYYTNGKLSHILSMSDKYTGVVQTNKFKEFFPSKLSSNISYLQAECLVDVRLYENARGKANGLVNSKWIQEDVEKYTTIVGFRLVDINNEILSWDEVKEMNIIPIHRENTTVPKFIISPEVHEIDLVERGIGHYISKDKTVDFKFCLDGIVYAEDNSWDKPWCYKYDYLYTAKTTVLDIIWSETSSEGFSSVLAVDPVELENKWIYGPSTNGVPKMIELGCGIGSTIEVAFSGLTIPKVINVIEKGPISYPVCFCGKQLSEDNIHGALIKCDDPNCSRKLELRQGWMVDHLNDKPIEDEGLSDKEYILKYLEWFVFTYLNIARFNYETCRWHDFSGYESQLLESIMSEDVEGFKQIIYDNYSMTYLRKQDIEINSLSTIKVIKEKLND